MLRQTSPKQMARKLPCFFGQSGWNEYQEAMKAFSLR